jgi:hypothetical protein
LLRELRGARGVCAAREIVESWSAIGTFDGHNRESLAARLRRGADDARETEDIFLRARTPAISRCRLYDTARKTQDGEAV